MSSHTEYAYGLLALNVREPCLGGFSLKSRIYLLYIHSGNLSLRRTLTQLLHHIYMQVVVFFFVYLRCCRASRFFPSFFSPGVTGNSSSSTSLQKLNFQLLKKTVISIRIFILFSTPQQWL